MKTEAEQAAWALEPIVKEVYVPLSVERAFRLFTARIGEWWPLATHSVEGEKALGCRLEPRIGGRLLEMGPGGTEQVWGTLLEWQPPQRLVMTWHPGRAEDTAQRLSVTFEAAGERTRLRLVHSGWVALAIIAPGERDDYDSGWDYVLGRYSEAVSGA